MASADVAIGEKSCSCLDVVLSDSHIITGDALAVSVGIRAPMKSGTFSAYFDVVFRGDRTQITRVSIKYEVLARFEFARDYSRICIDTNDPQTSGVVLVRRGYDEQSDELSEVSATLGDEDVSLDLLSTELQHGIVVTRYQISMSEFRRALPTLPFQGNLTVRSAEKSLVQRIRVVEPTSLQASPDSLYLASTGDRSEVRVVISAKSPFEIIECTSPDDILTISWARRKATAHVCIVRPAIGKSHSSYNTTNLRVVADSGQELDIPILLLGPKG